MKRLILTFLISFPLLAAVFIMNTNQVEAAPVCYVAIDAERTRGADCADYEGLTLGTALLAEPIGETIQDGEVMQDGFCYLWGEFGVVKYAISSQDCKSLELVGVAGVFTPPTCYKYDGPSNGVYQGFDVTKLSTVGCNELEEQIKKDLRVNEPSQNTCYVLGTDGSITVPGCEELQRTVDAGNEAALNPEREAVTNCDGRANGGNPQDCFETNPIVRLILQFINFLSIGIGVIVTIVIIVGGIQYMTAGPNPQAVSAAKKRITNAILALLAYFLLYAFLQWVVPGGII